MALIVQMLESASIGASTPSPATITLATGLPGPQGLAATVTVGSTTTLAPGSSATVVNSGTTSAAVLDFGIPAGQQGIQGIQGPVGPQGPSGVLYATSPLAYDSGTKTVSIDLSAYLTISAAAATYYPATNPSGFITSSALSGYATQAWVSSQGYLTSSSLAGYATEAWVSSQGYITASALTPYLTTSAAASTYQTLAGMSDYLTTSAAASLYAPLARGIPAGGTAGQVLSKVNGTDYSVAWTTVSSSSAAWGSITGTLSAQTDLNTALGLKANLASPALTGTPTAPTATAGTSTTQIATTAFVTAVDVLKANIASPTFTGTPAAPTATAGTNTTQLATTAFVTTAVSTKANIASPTFTGVPAAPTAAAGTSTTQIATTAFVTAVDILKAPIASPTFTGTVTIPAGASISGYLTTAIAASTYAVTARGLPAGGTSGQVLTKVNGTDYNSSWTTIIPGDRYLTTSTTSLTINNATKTLTVGTGLSYSPQQDVTISESTNPTTRHMHALVTSYNSGTGVLVVDVISHSGAGTYSSWVVNVGGATPATSVAWGSITGTLSDQTDLQTALDGKIGDAPSDGLPYVRKDGAWEALIIS